MDLIVYAVIALLVAYRLYTVLGSRNGNERPRGNPFAAPPTNPIGKPDGRPPANRPQGGEAPDVLAMPLGVQQERDNPLSLTNEPARDSLAGQLRAMAKIDPAFDDKAFLKGARVAFEMIVQSFAAGERAALKNLVSARLFAAFESAIAAREAAGEKMEMKILNLREADITQGRLDNTRATLTVQFISDQQKITTDKSGNSHDEGLKQITDIWSFQRDLASADPNWMLVETRSV